MSADNLQATLLALELELLSPAVRDSDTRLNELLAQEFVEFGSSGKIFDKRSIISMLIHSTATERFEVQDFRLVSSNQHQGLAVYTCSAYAESGEVLRLSNRSSFWVLRDARWQLLFHQGTKTT